MEKGIYKLQSQIDSICLLDFDITLLTAEQLVENCLNSESKNRTINTINPHSYVQQKTNKSFRKALKESHFLIPDGSGILFAARLIFFSAILRVLELLGWPTWPPPPPFESLRGGF